MELKEILNQNSLKASSKLNYISNPDNSSKKEASHASLQIKKEDNQSGHLGARYGDIFCSLMESMGTNTSIAIQFITKSEYTSNHDISRKKREF